MTELERFEQLARKLVHHLPEVRQRAGRNLLFKLESVVDHGIIRNPVCLQILSEGIEKAISDAVDSYNAAEAEHSMEIEKGVVETSTDGDSLPKSYANLSGSLEILLPLITAFGKTCSGDTFHSLISDKVMDTMSLILERLYVLSTLTWLPSNISEKLHEAIKFISHIGSPIVNENILNTTKSNYNYVSKHDEMNASSIFSSTRQSHDEKSKLVSSPTLRKAGAILGSALSFNGWKFHPVSLIDSDERFLYDIEVKVRLGHKGCEEALFNALADFPAHTLLSRAGLIQCVLDAVGSIYSDVDAHSCILTPIKAMAWLEGLASKAIDAFRNQMKGTLCSTVPQSHSTANLYSHKSNNKHDDNIHSSIDEDSLAAQLAKSMYAMRHPLLPTYPVSQPQDNVVNISTPPAPSFSGYCFAICAASLPLIQTRDPAVITAVVSLFKVALRFVKEPSTTAITSNLNETLDFGRLQHLLNRSEQLLAFSGGTFKLNFDPLMSVSENETENDENMHDFVSKAALTHLCITIWEQLPLECVKSKSNATMENSEKEKYELGNFSLKLLAHLCEKRKFNPLNEGDMESLVGTAGVNIETMDKFYQENCEISTSENEEDDARANIFSLTHFTTSSSTALSTSKILERLMQRVDPDLYAQYQAAHHLVSTSFRLSQLVTNISERGSKEIILSHSQRLDFTKKMLSIASECILLIEKDYIANSQNRTLTCSLTHAISETIFAGIVSGVLGSESMQPTAPLGRKKHDGFQMNDHISVTRHPFTNSAVILLLRVICNGAWSVKNDIFTRLLQSLSFCDNNCMLTGLGVSVENEHIIECIKSSLAIPSVIHSLLLFGFLNTIADEGSSVDTEGSSHEGSTSSIDVRRTSLDFVCMLLTNRISDQSWMLENVSEWAVLLPPLMLVNWEINSQVEGGGISYSSHQRHIINTFCTLLDNQCSDSSDEFVRILHLRSNIVGIFHYMPMVRERCARFLSSSKSRRQIHSTSISDPFPPTGMDPGRLNITLGSWKSGNNGTSQNSLCGISGINDSNDIKKNDASGVGAYKHADARKLAAIAWSECDASISSCALRQLRLVLSDYHLLGTARQEWIASLVTEALKTVVNVVAESFIDKEKEKQCIEAALLLRFLCASSSVARDSLMTTISSSSFTSSQSDFDFGPILSVVITSQHSFIRSLSEEAFSLVRICLSQSLCICISHWEAWTIKDPLFKFKPSPLSSSMISSTLPNLNSFPHVQVPAFLSYHFNPPSMHYLASSPAGPYAGYLIEAAYSGDRSISLWELINLECSSEPSYHQTIMRSNSSAASIVQSLHPNADVWEGVWSGLDRMSKNSMLHQMAMCIERSISSSMMHFDLHQAISNAILLVKCIPDLASTLSHKHIAYTLNRVVETLPSLTSCSRNDFTTMQLSLQLLSGILPSIAESFSVYNALSVGQQEFIRECIEVVSGPLCKIISHPPNQYFNHDSKYSTISRNVAHDDSEDPDDVAIALYYSQTALTSLCYEVGQCINIFRDSMLSSSDIPHTVSLSTLGSVAHHLINLCGGELWTSFMRKRAGDALESICSNSAKICKWALEDSKSTFSIALSHTPNHSSTQSPTPTPLDRLYRSIKMLRTPDSLIGSGSLISSLRTMLAVLNQDNPMASSWISSHDWSFLIRMGYDRRAAVRILALELSTLCSHAGVWNVSQPMKGGGGNEEDNNNNDDSCLSHSCSPCEMLRHLMSDASECVSLRIKSARLIMMEAIVGNIDVGPLIGCILCSCADILSMSMTIPSAHQVEPKNGSKFIDGGNAAAIEGSISNLVFLYSICKANLHLLEEFVASLKTLKIMGLVVHAFNNELSRNLEVKALARVGLYASQRDNNILAHSASNMLRSSNRTSDKANTGHQQAPTMQQHLGGSGWDREWDSVKADETLFLSLARTSACRLLLLLGLGESTKDLLSDILQHSKLVDNMFYTLASSSDDALSLASNDIRYRPQDVHYITMEGVALSEFIALSYSFLSVGKSKDLPSFSTFMCMRFLDAHLLQHSEAILTALTTSSLAAVRVPPSHLISSLTSLLRCLVLTLKYIKDNENSDGRRTIESGMSHEGCVALDNRFDDVENSGTSNVDDDIAACSDGIFTSLLGIRSTVELLLEETDRNDGHIAVKDLVFRLDVAISLLVTFAPHLKQRVMQPQVGVSSDFISHSHSGPAVLRNCVKKVCACLEDLSVAGPTSHTLPHSVDVKGDLTTLKSRVSHSTSSDKRKANITTSPASMSNTTNGKDSKWRSKTRSYKWTNNNDTSKSTMSVGKVVSSAFEDMPGFKQTHTIVNTRIDLWRSLLLLSSFCVQGEDGGIRNGNDAQKACMEGGLDVYLPILVRLIGMWSMKDCLANGSDLKGRLCGGISNAQLAGAALGFLCAIIHGNDNNKQILLSLGETVATISSKDSKDGGLIHQLLSISLSQGVTQSTRWASLSLLQSLVTCSPTSHSLSNSLTKLISSAIQKSLHSHTDLDQIPLFVDVYSASLMEGGRGGGVGSTSAGLKEAFDNSNMTTTQILNWIWEDLGSHRQDVKVSIVRCIGRLGCFGSGLGGWEGLWGKRLAATVINSEILSMLLTSIAATTRGMREEQRVREVATVALWTILYHSESARSVLKQIIRTSSNMSSTFILNALNTASLDDERPTLALKYLID